MSTFQKFEQSPITIPAYTIRTKIVKSEYVGAVCIFLIYGYIICLCLHSDYLEARMIAIHITLQSFLTSGQQMASSRSLPVVATSPAAAACESMFPEPTNLEQPRSGGAEGTSEEHLQGEALQDPPTKRDIWRAIRASKKALNRLFKYLKVKLGVGVVSDTEGSLLIKVTCSSLEILEGLWEDYSSGHLNEVIEQTLVTSDILEKFGLSELRLKTAIKEEEYKKCKEFFLSEHQVR